VTVPAGPLLPPARVVGLVQRIVPVHIPFEFEAAYFWGIVLTGSITITHADGTSETTEAGQVYHWPAGHTGVTEGGVTFIEVGPLEPMRQFSEHARKLFS
jgi:hypothetical protein